ncbi:hypothetical protein T261_3516 [Streptomyces lydicus]|nr:hypothetical protein T261_3516 [Streptomyces lydicus]
MSPCCAGSEPVINPPDAGADAGAGKAWFFDLMSRSWAAAVWEGSPGATVYQSGPRRLWDEVEAAHGWWAGRGMPDHTRFGLTVTAEGGQRAWLDDPAESWTV